MLQRILYNICNSLKNIVQKVKDIMGEYSKKLHIRKNGTIEDITLYTNSDISDNTIKVRDGGTICYAPIGATNDSNASSLMVRKDGEICAVLKQGIKIDGKYIFNTGNYKGPIDFIIDNKVYSINGYNDGSEYALFRLLKPSFSAVHFTINCGKNSSVNSSMFSSGGVFYQFFMNHKMKMSIENTDSYILWNKPDDCHSGTQDRGRIYGIAYYSANNPKSNTPLAKTCSYTDIYNAFNKGKNIIIEFIAR